MNPPDWTQKADEALKRAARRARETAIRTGTPLLVQKEGRLVRIKPADSKP